MSIEETSNTVVEHMERKVTPATTLQIHNVYFDNDADAVIVSVSWGTGAGEAYHPLKYQAWAMIGDAISGALSRPVPQRENTRAGALHGTMREIVKRIDDNAALKAALIAAGDLHVHEGHRVDLLGDFVRAGAVLRGFED